jgi:hypothetical protein
MYWVVSSSDDRDLQLGARDHAVGDRVANARVGAGRVADEGDAGLEGQSGVHSGFERPARDRLLEEARQVERGYADVGVAIEDAGHEEQTRGIHGRRRLQRKVASNGCDGAVADVDVDRPVEPSGRIEGDDTAERELAHVRDSSRARRAWTGLRGG